MVEAFGVKSSYMPLYIFMILIVHHLDKSYRNRATKIKLPLSINAL